MRPDAPIRWVHLSEEADPTPWLSGGELLLITGKLLAGDDVQREYVARLADHGLAGLGFGTGLGFDTRAGARCSRRPGTATSRSSRCRTTCPSLR